MKRNAGTKTWPFDCAAIARAKSLMNTADRFAAMTHDIPHPITVGDLVRFGADAADRHRLAFEVAAGGQHLAQVAIIPGHSGAPQEHVDRLASCLRAFFLGSEYRVSDAEDRLASVRAACDRRDLEIQRLKDRLADFEAGRAVRGEFFAIEDTQGVWLAGRPSSAAWGLHYRSWAELARERPGLRPCGTRKSDDPFGPVETYIVLRPIADLEGSTP